MSLFRVLLCLIFVLACPLKGLGDESDDGLVLYSKGKWRNTELEFKTSIRGQTIRLDLAEIVHNQPVSYLLDVASQSVFQLLPTKKIAKGPFFTDSSSIQGDLKKKVPQLHRTGKTETIAGYLAEQYIRTYEDGRAFEVWLTQDIKLPSNILRSITAFTRQFAREDANALAEQGAFELRKVGRLADGSVWMINEVIKVERATLKDEVFDIPPDFQRIEAQSAEAAEKNGSQ